jgi:hypothetical protein
MKVLVLVIYNESDIYNKMLEIQKSYMHTNSNIDVFYIIYRKNQKAYIEFENNIIYINGLEISWFNILEKTIIALDTILNILNCKYDYIVRTNISTIIKLNELYTYLLKLPKTNVYTGGIINKICIDPHCGITPYKFDLYNCKDTFFVSGTSIIMSYDVCKNILNNKHLLKYDLFDDVAIGLFVKKYLTEAYVNIYNYSTITDTNPIYENRIFIRNKCSNNREDDIINMQNFVLKYKLENNL